MITSKELYDYILTQMTAEEALLKFLSGELEVYEKLSENKPLDPDTDKVHPLFIISAAAMDLGWQLAIEKTDDGNDMIRGLVVGTDEYMKTIFHE